MERLRWGLEEVASYFRNTWTKIATTCTDSVRIESSSTHNVWFVEQTVVGEGFKKIYYLFSTLSRIE